MTTAKTWMLQKKLLGNSQTKLVPITEIIDNFNKYVEWARSDLLDFTTNAKNAITLMSSLQKTKASLDMYETIIDWHFHSTGLLLSTQQLSGCRHFVSRENIV